MKTKTFLAAAAVFGAASLFAAPAWLNLDDAHWLAGPKITGSSLRGKVVLVDEWGLNCPPCRKLLPKMAELWDLHKDKRFMLLGAHLQKGEPDAIRELLAAAKASYPVYQGAQMDGAPDNGGSLPFLYVLNARGEVVYSGRRVEEAIEAVVNALSDLPVPGFLVTGVNWTRFKGKRRSFERLGSPAEGAALSAFKTALKSKKAGVAADAQAILDAIEKRKASLKEEIEEELASDPAAALRDMNWLVKSWPSEKKNYEAKIKELAAQPDVKKKADELTKAAFRRK